MIDNEQSSMVWNFHFHISYFRSGSLSVKELSSLSIKPALNSSRRSLPFRASKRLFDRRVFYPLPPSQAFACNRLKLKHARKTHPPFSRAPRACLDPSPYQPIPTVSSEPPHIASPFADPCSGYDWPPKEKKQGVAKLPDEMPEILLVVERLKLPTHASLPCIRGVQDV